MTRTRSIGFAILCCSVWGMSVQSAAHLARTARTNLNGPAGQVGGMRGNMLDGLHMGFSQNRGQVADYEGKPRPDILYTTELGGARLYFTRQGVSTVFSRIASGDGISEANARRSASLPRERDSHEEQTIETFRLDMFLVGANPSPEVQGKDELPGPSNYYFAHCPSGVANVPRNAKLVYRNVYDGIDLVYRSIGIGRMKYEFIIHPGADPADIRMRYNAGSLTITSDGHLHVHCPIGAIEESSPDVYQDGVPVPECSFAVVGRDVTFSIGEYDKTKTLVIDPWGVYLGGDGPWPTKVTVSSSGDIIVAGRTSAAFPASNGFQTTYGGGTYDCFIAKFNSSGTLAWSTFFGGTDDDQNLSATTGASGTIYVTGFTTSGDLPVLNAYQPVYGGNQDAFLLKISNSGTLLWATYLGGGGSDTFNGTVVDGSGNIFVGGNTSGQFPVLNAYDDTHNGGNDFILAKFTSAGSLLWASYYGGPNDDGGARLSFAANGDVIVKTRSKGGFAPMINSYDDTHNGGDDDVIIRFAPNGVPVWSTYFGGSGDEGIGSLTDEIGGKFYFSGRTTSPDLPMVNPYQPSYQGGSDCYLVGMNGQGVPVWSTYLGGDGYEEGGDVETGASGSIYVGGSTSTPTNVYFPSQNALLPTFHPNENGYLARFYSTYSLAFSTFLYGTPRAAVRCGTKVVCIAPSGGNVFLVGMTNDDFYPTMGQFPPLWGAGYYGYLLMMSANGGVPVELSALSVRIAGRKVHLAWTTETETGNTGFEVQRTTTPASGNWATCGFVAGAGTCTSRRDYTFVEDIPHGFTEDQSIYYRLKQIDTDGSFQYSGIIEALLGGEPKGFAILDVHPQPAQGDVTVHLSGSNGVVMLRIIDVLGRTVSEYRSSGAATVQLDLTSAPAGVYTLIAEQGAARAVRRIILQ